MHSCNVLLRTCVVACALTLHERYLLEVASGGTKTGHVNQKEEEFATDLIKRIRLFIRRFLSKSDRGPSTAQILSEFNDVKDSDAILFKSVLKQVAVVSSGHWELR